MENVSTDTWVRTIVTVIALSNQLLTMTGKNPLPISETDAYTLFTAAFAIGATVWAWWKNNSFTQKAIKADEYLAELKK